MEAQRKSVPFPSSHSYRVPTLAISRLCVLGHYVGCFSIPTIVSQHSSVSMCFFSNEEKRFCFYINLSGLTNAKTHFEYCNVQKETGERSVFVI